MTGAGADALPVAIDFKSPHAYLAIAPTCALADALGIAVAWEPFLVAPARKRRPAAPDDDRGTRHRRLRAQYVVRDLLRYAAARGLELRGLERETDSTLAALGLLWVTRARPALGRAYVERVFDRYWQETLEIESASALHDMLRELGAPTSGFERFAGREGRATLERVQAELREAGVFDVPAYRVEGDVFHGRQHLPMIRWLLSGRAGEPPL